MKRPRYLLTLDGIGLAKPSTTRRKAMRARRWWSKRLALADLAVVRL